MRWILFIIVYLLLGWYAFQAFKTVYPKPIVLIGIGVVWLLAITNLYYQFLMVPDLNNGISTAKMYAISFVMIFIVFELFVIAFLLTEDIYRAANWIFQKLFSSNQTTLPSRRRFISLIAIGIASLPFGALLYGMYKGKYNYKVLTYDLEFDDLPDSFNGYTITHISDIHSGSFDDKEKVEYAVNLINKQKSDVLFFTGDLVNNKAEEMDPWMDVFSKLEAKEGKYSVLGNHDYGDYIEWSSELEKSKNLDRLKAIHGELGFDLILNDHRYLTKGNDKIALVGVENWGAGGFKKAGDLDKSIQKIEASDFKILLSHDPSHWEKQVIQHPQKFHLTLSGHTHGMQFGIEIPGWIKWSPVKWRYTYWAGIYKEMDQYINVNRGFGFLGYPGRFGIWPEISVIRLKKKQIV